MYYISGIDRNQLQFFNSLENSIEEDNPVRIIDALVELLYNKEPEKFHTKGLTKNGRKPYHPTTLLKLYLYGYLNRITSSRRLEAETHRNIEVKWLLCDLHPDFKTIADYRKDNKDTIRYVTISFRNFLKEEGFIEGKKIIYDGSKVKACSSKEKVLNDRKISSRLKKMEQQLEAYLSQLNSNDHTEELSQELDSFLEESNINKALLEEVANLRKQIEEMQLLKENLSASKYNTFCPTDADAHMMKSRDGFIPAYNLQVGTDSKNKMIVLAEVSTENNDINLLEEDFNNTQEQMGIIPDIIEADKGYANLTQIESIESNGNTKCAIPLPITTSSVHNKKVGVEFTYDSESDTYICINGKTLRHKQNTAIHSGRVFDIYKAKKNDCLHCRFFGRCTTSKNGRALKIPQNKQFQDQYTNRLESNKMKELIKERKAQIEHVFGTLKRWMGKVPLLLTSKRKVQIEIDIYSTAYNLKRLMNLESVPLLLERIAQYAQKIRRNTNAVSFYVFLLINLDSLTCFNKKQASLA